MKKILVCLLAFGLFSCNMEEMKQIKLENEQLKAALGESNTFAEELNEKMNKIDVLMDSIESAEQSLTLGLAEGVSYDNYEERLRNVQNYIENSKTEISKLEKSLSSTVSKNKLFMRQISELKKNVAEREQTIVQLSNQVNEFREENSSLVKTVDLQKGEIMAQERLINDKKLELAQIEANLAKLQADAKMAQADAYFARAETNVELAEKTKLAPKKKKEHYKDAYELFKQSFEMGRADAFKKMEEMEKEMD